MSTSFASPVAGHPYEIWQSASGPRPSWPKSLSPLGKAGPGDVLGFCFRLQCRRSEVDPVEIKAVIARVEDVPERSATSKLIGKSNAEPAARLALSMSLGDPLMGFRQHPAITPVFDAWREDDSKGMRTPVQRSLWVFHSTALLMPWHGLYESNRADPAANPMSHQIHLFYTPPSSAHHAMAVQKELAETQALARTLVTRAGEQGDAMVDPAPANFSVQLSPM